MARSRFCRVCKDFHELDAAWPSACYGHFGVVASDAPYVRPDGMDPLQSMVSGKMHDSKSAYYAEVRRAGCEIVGDDRAGYGPRYEYRPQGVAQSIKEAIERLSSR